MSQKFEFESPKASEPCFRCKRAEVEYQNDNGDWYCIDCSDELCTRCACHTAEHETVRGDYICFPCVEAAADAMYEHMRDVG